MKNAIILHGRPSKEEYYSDLYPSASNSHWLPWLQKQLLIKDIPAYTPEVPYCYDLDYENWCKEFERCEITAGTTLVGHSCGGGFIVRWLGEHPEAKVDKVILVAPGAPAVEADWSRSRFFDFAINPNLATQTQGITIFSSDNDSPGIMESVQKYRAIIKDVQYREFKGYGHFTLKRMGTDAFPELLEEILR
jgi:predicted alpha/beta hydrolase family esterase